MEENTDSLQTAEKAVQEIISEVSSGNVTGFFQNLWIEHQDDIIRFGKVLVLSLIVVLIACIFSRILGKVIRKAVLKIEAFDEAVGRVLISVSRVFLWLFAMLIILDLFGINTTSLMTVLGAAGLAVGLAMKDSLSNIAAGIMLLILRPYRIGDYIDCGPVSGTIKTMGLFATELETVDGIFIAAPNSVVFGTPVKNYSRNVSRRADISVGIAYGDDLQKGIAILLDLMQKNTMILKDPAPQVLVSELADSSVNLTLRFWTSTADYWDVYWQVKEELKNTIESAGLNIPFPQRVVTVISGELPESK